MPQYNVPNNVSDATFRAGSLAPAIVNTSNALEDLYLRATAASAAAATAQARADSAHSSIAGVNNRIDGVAEEVDALQAWKQSISGLPSKVTTLENKINTVQGTANDARSKNTEQDGRLSSVESSVDSLQSWRDSQTGGGSGTNLSTEVSGLKTRVSSVENKNTSQDSRLTTLEARRDSALGGTVGHVIVDDDLLGSPMPQRNKLQIVGASTFDDAASDTTILTVDSGAGGGVEGEVTAYDPNSRIATVRYTLKGTVIVSPDVYNAYSAHLAIGDTVVVLLDADKNQPPTVVGFKSHASNYLPPSYSILTPGPDYPFTTQGNSLPFHGRWTKDYTGILGSGPNAAVGNSNGTASNSLRVFSPASGQMVQLPLLPTIVNQIAITKNKLVAQNAATTYALAAVPMFVYDAANQVWENMENFVYPAAPTAYPHRLATRQHTERLHLDSAGNPVMYFSDIVTASNISGSPTSTGTGLWRLFRVTFDVATKTVSSVKEWNSTLFTMGGGSVMNGIRQSPDRTKIAARFVYNAGSGATRVSFWGIDTSDDTVSKIWENPSSISSSNEVSNIFSVSNDKTLWTTGNVFATSQIHNFGQNPSENDSQWLTKANFSGYLGTFKWNNVSQNTVGSIRVVDELVSVGIDTVLIGCSVVTAINTSSWYFTRGAVYQTDGVTVSEAFLSPKPINGTQSSSTASAPRVYDLRLVNGNTYRWNDFWTSNAGGAQFWDHYEGTL